MPDIASLSVKIDAETSGLESGLARANQQVAGLGSAMSSVFAGMAQGVGMRVFDTIATGLESAGKAAIGFNSNMEQSTIAFTSMLGSAEKAQAFLDEMKQFAATTPFEFPDLLKASKQMMAFGFAAKDVKPLLTSVGSAAAAMGTGRAGVDSITKALGQMRAATVVQAGELNQLTEQGVPAFQILADAMGISTGEVKKLASEGKIASDVFINAFQTWADTKYGDMMSKQALTFEGAMSNIKDSLTFAVAEGAKPFFEAVSAGAVQLSQFVQGETFTAWAKSFADTTRDAFRQVGDAIRTVQQVLNDDWVSSDQIEPFTKAIGEAALALKTNLGPAVQAVSGFVTGTLIPAIQRVAVPLAAFAAGFGGTIVTLGLASVAISAVAAVLGLLLSPLGLVAIAVGALAAAWTLNLGGIQETTMQFVAIVQQALSGDIAGAFTALVALIGTTTTDIIAQLVLWGQAFIDWIAPMIPPMLDALATAGLALLGWISEQIPPIIAQLTLWATEFVAWVAPFIPPLLAALATVAVALLGWLAAQIPPIIAQLLLWGAEFIAWVAPQIPGLLSELGKLILALWDWQIAQVPGITAKLVEWGILFGLWVGTTAVPELIKALPGIVTTIGAWVETAKIEIGQRLVALGAAIVTGIFNGFTAAWATIGPQIQAAIANYFRIPDIRMPSLQWGTGSGGGGGSAQSYTGAPTGGGSLSAVVPGGRGGFTSGGTHTGGTAADVFAAMGSPIHAPVGGTSRPMLDQKGGNATIITGDDGKYYYMAHGNTPFAGGRVAAGQQIGQVGDTGNAKGTSPHLHISVSSTGNFPGGQGDLTIPLTGPANATVPAPAPGRPAGQRLPGDMDRIPLSNAPGGDPSQWPGFMNQVEEQLPAYLMSLDTIQGKGAQTFVSVLDTGVAAGGALVTASTDSFGNVTRIYSDATGVIGATITNAAGLIVNTWGAMSTGTVAQTAVMATGVAAQTNLMASGALTSVTNLGTGILTSVTTTSGTTIATVAGMSGAVTSQYATLANGVSLTMGDMAAGVMTSTTDLGTGMLTVVQDSAGNYIATVTDLAGNVTSQYTQLAADVVATTTTQNAEVVADTVATGTKLIEETTNLAGVTVARYTEMSGEIVTIVTDQNGKILADFTTSAQDIGKVTTDSNTRRLSETTNALGQTVTVYREASGAIVTLVTDTAGKTVQQFTNVGNGAKTMADTVRTAGKAFGEMPPPNMSAHVAQLKSATNAALAYQKALVAAAKASEDLAGKPGGKKGGSKELAKRHTGGPVDAFMPYLVGAPGAEELFVPDRAGQIYSGKLMTPSMSSGGDVSTHVFIIRDPDGRTLENWYVTGKDMAVRRGRN